MKILFKIDDKHFYDCVKNRIEDSRKKMILFIKNR